MLNHSLTFSNYIKLSGGIRVRIPQKLYVVVFWSWNLDVVDFQSWNPDVVTFCHLKKCLGITLSWFNCLRFSMPWCFSPRISMSWFFGLGSSMSWYMCLHGLVFVFIVKTEKSRKIFWIVLTNISMIQIYATVIRIKHAYAN